MQYCTNCSSFDNTSGKILFFPYHHPPPRDKQPAQKPFLSLVCPTRLDLCGRRRGDRKRKEGRKETPLSPFHFFSLSGTQRLGPSLQRRRRRRREGVPFCEKEEGRGGSLLAPSPSLTRPEGGRRRKVGLFLSLSFPAVVFFLPSLPLPESSLLFPSSCFFRLC